MPITGIAFCCAWLASGYVTALPSAMSSSRRFIRTPPAAKAWPTRNLSHSARRLAFAAPRCHIQVNALARFYREECAEVIQAIRAAIDGDRYVMSPRVRRLKSALAKLDPASAERALRRSRHRSHPGRRAWSING